MSHFFSYANRDPDLIIRSASTNRRLKLNFKLAANTQVRSSGNTATLYLPDGSTADLSLSIVVASPILYFSATGFTALGEYRAQVIYTIEAVGTLDVVAVDTADFIFNRIV